MNPTGARGPTPEEAQDRLARFGSHQKHRGSRIFNVRYR
jgi:hypothetical protein